MLKLLKEALMSETEVLLSSLLAVVKYFQGTIGESLTCSIMLDGFTI